MKNWITYLEKYKSNRELLDRYREGIEKVRTPGKHPEYEKRVNEEAAKLEDCVRHAEDRLAHYIPEGCTPREARQLADEKMFLTCRYVLDMTIMQTAYNMCVSRDTVYRIRRRVLTRRFPFKDND